MAEPSAAPSCLLDVPDEGWAEAVRRETVVRPLAATKTSRVAVTAAARDLGLSTAQLYQPIQAFRTQPVTRSLVATKPGPKQGARLLPEAVEQQIGQAIDAIYKTRERPTPGKLQRDIRTDCRIASLKPPSRRAIQARILAPLAQGADRGAGGHLGRAPAVHAGRPGAAVEYAAGHRADRPHAGGYPDRR